MFLQAKKAIAEADLTPTQQTLANKVLNNWKTELKSRGYFQSYFSNRDDLKLWDMFNFEFEFATDYRLCGTGGNFLCGGVSQIVTPGLRYP